MAPKPTPGDGMAFPMDAMDADGEPYDYEPIDPPPELPHEPVAS